MIKREIIPILLKAAKEFPAVVLTGPRQSGKTTLLKHLFGGGYRMVSLEAPDIRAVALHDPRGFLAEYAPPVVFDEIQQAPELLPYIQERIDERREVPGQYLLTGSQNLLLMEQVTETLAGRAAILRLSPLSRREWEGRMDAPFSWEEGAICAAGVKPDYWTEFLRGSYPELVANPGREIELWHGSYLQTYLERDVRRLRQIGDLSQFQDFLRMLATRSGQLLNVANLARDLGLAPNSVKGWISVLEASCQIVVVRPYFANIGKRLVKSPKIYLVDTGLLCYLTGLRTPDHAASGPLGGGIVETAVLSELVKSFWNRGREPRLHFWRTAAGEEVDFVVEENGHPIPIEAKQSATPRPSMADGVRAFMRYHAGACGTGQVVYLGAEVVPLGDGIRAVPLNCL